MKCKDIDVMYPTEIHGVRIIKGKRGMGFVQEGKSKIQYQNKDKIIKDLKKYNQKLKMECNTYKIQKHHFEMENQKLKDNAINNDKVVDKVNWENMLLKKKISEAIKKLTLLTDIGFDYDGLNTVESLKTLIDELVSYAIDARNILGGTK